MAGPIITYEDSRNVISVHLCMVSYPRRLECSKFPAFITVALGRRRAGKEPMVEGRGGTRTQLKMEAERRVYIPTSKPHNCPLLIKQAMHVSSVMNECVPLLATVL